MAQKTGTELWYTSLFPRLFFLFGVVDPTCFPPALTPDMVAGLPFCVRKMLSACMRLSVPGLCCGHSPAVPVTDFSPFFKGFSRGSARRQLACQISRSLTELRLLCPGSRYLGGAGMKKVSDMMNGVEADPTVAPGKAFVRTPNVCCCCCCFFFGFFWFFWGFFTLSSDSPICSTLSTQHQILNFEIRFRQL